MPASAPILHALREEPRQQSELRRLAGSPAQTTLRGHLRKMERIGAVEKHRRDAFPGALQYELTASGRGLLFVAEVLDSWLAEAPEGALALGDNAAKAATRALCEAWSTTMLRALAAGPLSLTELDRVIGSLSYPSLERRLAAMRLTGLVEACPGDGRGMPYGVTAWLRKGAAPLAAATRWERRNLPTETAPITPLDVETAFLLTVPGLQPPGGLSGSCRLAVEVSNGRKRRLAGVVAKVVAGGGVSSCTTSLERDADGWALGSAAAWLNAVIDGDVDRLELGGDYRLARALLECLKETFFSDTRPASLRYVP